MTFRLAPDASGIEIEVHEGDVLLKETIDRRENKRFAEDIAASVRGVTDVQNQLQVTSI